MPEKENLETEIDSSGLIADEENGREGDEGEKVEEKTDRLEEGRLKRVKSYMKNKYEKFSSREFWREDWKQTREDVKYVGRKIAKPFESQWKKFRKHLIRNLCIDALILGAGYLSLVGGASAADIAYNKYISKPDHYKIFNISRDKDLKKELKQQIADLLNSCHVPPEDVQDVEFVFGDFMIKRHLKKTGGDRDDISFPRARRIKLENKPLDNNQLLDKTGIIHELGEIRCFVLGREIEGPCLWYVEECERREDTRVYYSYRGTIRDLNRINCFSIDFYRDNTKDHKKILTNYREIASRMYDKRYSETVEDMPGNEGCVEERRKFEQVFAGILKKNPSDGRKISPDDFILTIPIGWDDYPDVFKSYNRFYFRTGKSFFQRYRNK